MPTLAEHLASLSQNAAEQRTDAPVEYAIPPISQVPINRDTNESAQLDVSKSALLARSPDGEFMSSPWDGLVDRKFTNGNGVVKLWIGMPLGLMERAIRLALERSNGHAFRVEHATPKEAADIERDWSGTSDKSN